VPHSGAGCWPLRDTAAVRRACAGASRDARNIPQWRREQASPPAHQLCPLARPSRDYKKLPQEEEQEKKTLRRD